LDFEAAASQHAKVAKIKAILSVCDDICGRLDRLDAVIIQPSVEEKSVALFHFHGGELSGPVSLTMEEEVEQSADLQQEIDQMPAEKAQEPAAPSRTEVVTTQTIDSRLRTALELLVTSGSPSTQRFSEELAILKRWYYRSHKVGEIFFANDRGELPMRRIARGATRVYRGEKESLSIPAKESQPTEIKESQ
jgi:hypothetical protein